MEKIIIEIKGGNIVGIFSTNDDIRVVIVDHDVTPEISGPYERDATFISGEGYTLFSSPRNEHIAKQIEKLKF